MLKFTVGNGQDIFLWHDPLHPGGPLLNYYGSEVLYGSGSSLNAKLSSMISNGHWNWPSARSNSHKDILSPLKMLSLLDADIVLWLLARSKNFHTSYSWQWIRFKAPKVP